MAENLQYRLYNASITPPGDAWAKIAEELDEEAAKRLSLKLQQATLAPPAAAWDNILNALNEENKEAKVIPISRGWARIAIAAIVIGIVALGGFYYFMSAGSNGNNTATQQTITPKITSPDNNNDNRSGDQATVNQNSGSGPQTTDAVLVTTAGTNRIAVASMGMSPRIRYSRVKRAPAANTSRLNVDGAIAQPIPVQAETTVPPKEYLTVAAPNGQPAKISARFADAVTYVLTDAPVDNMSAALKSISWKRRFNSWSNKLMNNVAFIPAGTNFLDIVELEALLKE